MKKTIRKHLQKKKDKFKKQLQRNHAQATTDYIEALTEYADDSSSDNIYHNDDEKLEYEEKEAYHPQANIYNTSNSNMLNYDLSSYDLSPHPLDSASCCNRIWQTMTSWWVLHLIQIGRQRALKVTDLYALPKTESLTNILSKWHHTIAKFSPNQLNIVRILWDIEKSDITFVFMLNLIRAFIIVGLLYLWQFLIAFYTDPDVPMSSGIVLALYMLILNLCRSILNSMITNTCSSMGTRIMGMVMSVMYDKGLKMDLESSKTQASLNIIGSNLEYIGWGLLYLPSSMIFAVILFIISFLFLYIIVGNIAFIGIAFVLCIGIPAQIYVLVHISTHDDGRFDISDERVSFMNDLFHGIKFIKLYSWEIPLMHRIAAYRKREKVHVDAYNKYLAWLRLINFLIPSIMLVLIVCLYLYIGHTLHMFVMFQLIIVAQILSGAIEMIPVHALFATEFVIALQRVDEFLSIPHKTSMIADSKTNIQSYMERDIAIAIRNADFEWMTTAADADDDKYKLRDVSLEIKRGKLIAIVGAVGAGKSSILHAILGEMNMLKGTHYVNGTPRNGNKNNVISYVPQDTFILNGSVRDNILLGLEFNEEKYAKVLAFSALEEDLHRLPFGDGTEIGEQGVTISGGQKMRISFARALYRCEDSDIFLFDDPLSSVDIDVGQIMFTKGIQSLLQNKTRVVVMNSHLFYLKYFDEIYVIEYNEETNESQIAAANAMNYDQLMTNYPQFTSKEFIQHKDENENKLILEKNKSKSKYKKAKHVQKQAVQINNVDSKQTGCVPFNVYREFFLCAVRAFDFESTWFKTKKYRSECDKNKDAKTEKRNIFLMIMTLIILIVAQICDPVADLILVIWTSDSNDSDSNDTHSSYWWISLWCGVIFIIAILRLISALFVSRWLSRAAFQLMIRTLYYTLRAPMQYYDVTPKSAILNRFTKDTNIIDIDIPFDFDIFSSQFLIAISYICIVCIFIPQMIIIFIFVSPIFYYLMSAYRVTYIECMRLCIAGLDPITSIFSETLCGLSSIRSYKLESYFSNIMDDRCTMFINLWYVRNSIYSWFDCSLDILIDFIVICATILGFYARDSAITSPALVAFAIVYLNIISGHLQVAMLQLVWLESEFGAVERLLYYHPAQHNISYEANPINMNYDIPRNWPSNGHIIIKNGLKLKYKNTNNYALNIKRKRIEIKSGEKIGICGRTGAGKSSLMVALFRLVEPDADCAIILDGVECTKIGLYDLRSAITIIPQDPILFVGTLRFNLDPFNKYGDDEIWNVLNKCYLSKVIRTRKDGLNCNVNQNGSNFSQGQKQLICIARALLKNTKVLLLDEATSSIDKETDYKIQILIRKHFKQTTVLCIAHRLETILDYDRIIVLNNGQIAQFDKPQTLIKDKTGLFAQMIQTAHNHH